MAVSSKKLTKMASRWMRRAGIARKTSFFRSMMENPKCTTTEAASTTKGHFAVYTNDGNRFMVPLKWLNNDIFVELLNKAEEAFGFGGDGPIIFPFHSSLMEDITMYLNGLLSQEFVEELLNSVGRRPCSSCTSIDQIQQLPIC